MGKRYKIRKEQLKLVVESLSVEKNRLFEEGKTQENSEELYIKNQKQDNVVYRNKRNLENHVLVDINDILLDNPVNLYGKPWEGRVAKSHIPHLPKASRVQMPHQGEKRSDGGSASIEFEDKSTWLEISPSKVKAHGYNIPNETFRTTDKEGLQTLLGIIKKITYKSGYWSDSDIQEIMRKSMSYFNQYVIDIDNLELDLK